MRNKLIRLLIAVCGGNAIYFALMRFLPERLQHQPFRIDAGLLIDFMICALLWFVLGSLKH